MLSCGACTFAAIPTRLKLLLAGWRYVPCLSSLHTCTASKDAIPAHLALLGSDLSVLAGVFLH